jgi:acyl dehydratase
LRTVSIDDLPSLAGEELGVSDWLTIDQSRIDRFADATGDHQWIHVNVARAKAEMPEGKTIAHGFLTLSLIPMLAAQILRVQGASRGINYGLNRVRFIHAVPVESRVRGRQKLLAAEPRGEALQITSAFVIEIAGQPRPACSAETIGLIYR